MDTQRLTSSHTGGLTDRRTNRGAVDIQKNTESAQTDKVTVSDENIQTDRQQTKRYADRNTNGRETKAGRQIGKQNRQTERQKDRQACRQLGRQPSRQLIGLCLACIRGCLPADRVIGAFVSETLLTIDDIIHSSSSRNSSSSSSSDLKFDQPKCPRNAVASFRRRR